MCRHAKLCGDGRVERLVVWDITVIRLLGLLVCVQR
jgi:hypothetical protein